MFWRRRSKRSNDPTDYEQAAEIVSTTSGIYADLNDREQLVKPRSALPDSCFRVREAFLTAYAIEYPGLTAKLRDSYQHVYRELAFFVEDELCERFTASLEIAAQCHVEWLRNIGLSADLAQCRRLIASDAVKAQQRREIWTHLAKGGTCPPIHVRRLFETLVFCSELHRAMSDEWAAHANLVAYRYAGENAEAVDETMK